MVPIPGNCCVKFGREDKISMNRNEEDGEFISGVVEGKIQAIILEYLRSKSSWTYCLYDFFLMVYF